MVLHHYQELSFKFEVATIDLKPSSSTEMFWLRFTNVTIQATLADDDAYGSGEAIFASVKQDYYGSQV